MNIPVAKMNIRKDEQELKFYIFTVQSGPVQIEFPEDFKLILAYNDSDAVAMIRRDYTYGLPLSVKKRGEVEIKKIINAVNVSEIAFVPQGVPVTAVPSVPEKTIQSFARGLMLIADKFVENKRDQASLKRIINKIKVHENQPIPTT